MKKEIRFPKWISNGALELKGKQKLNLQQLTNSYKYLVVILF